MKLGVFDPAKPELAQPTLQDLRRWLLEVSPAFCQFLAESTLVETCFWQHYKHKIVN